MQDRLCSEIPKALSDFDLPLNCYIFVFTDRTRKPKQYPGEWLASVQRPITGILDDVKHKCPGKIEISRHREKQATK